MNPAKLRRLAHDPRFLPGVYNYCDRWCERCPLSHRCLNFAMEQEWSGDDPAARDLSHQKFWDQLQAMFQLTLQMVQEEAARRGVDLEPPDAQAEAAAAEQRERRRAARDQPLARDALQYAQATAAWLKSSRRLFRNKGLELTRQAQLGVGQPLQEAEAILDWLEVIQWYHGVIHTKTVRALGSAAQEAEETDEALRALPRDSDGSAKVALLGIDRSLAAWSGLREPMPDAADTILDFQVQLARLRARVERTFPAARAFVRPGFDEDLGRCEIGS